VSSCPSGRWLHDALHRLHSTARRAHPGVGAWADCTPTADAPALDALGGPRGRRPIPTARPWAVFSGGGVCSSHPHRLTSAPCIWSGRPSSLSGSPPSARDANTPRAPRGNMLARSALATWGGHGSPSLSSTTIRATPAPRLRGARASSRSLPRSAWGVPAPSSAWRSPNEPAPRVLGTGYSQSAP